MTADGTYPSPRAGETVSTAAELDALPVGSVVQDRDGDAWQRRKATRFGWHTTSGGGYSKVHPAEEYAPLTVLFRPDAPQPATGDAVERAALAKVIHETIDAAYTFEGDLDPDVDQAVTDAVLALLAARGDAAPTVTAEQVERARLSEPLTYPPGQQVSRAAARHLLAALGIEVRD